VSNAFRLERSERSPRGLPTKVTSESVLASQSMNCSMVIKLPSGVGVAATRREKAAMIDEVKAVNTVQGPSQVSPFLLEQ